MLYELRNLTRLFGTRAVLDIEQLDFLAGHIYALIGPNGAGKTTLLNQLAFLDQPSSGTLTFQDSPVRYERNGLTNLRRQVVLVDQSPILFSGTVWRNVEFGLKVRGVTSREREHLIMQALEQVGMAGFARTDVHGLSGGEVKRVALARALALDPEVLLCDEPTANVDRQHQEIILQIIEEANRSRNTTVIFSTHYLSQSRRLAHETILLRNGKVSTHLEENLFQVTFSENESGGLGFHLYDGYLSVDPGGLDIVPGSQGQIHIKPETVHLRPLPASGAEPKGLIGIVRSISTETGAIRVGVDIGAPLAARLDRSRFQQDPVQVCQKVLVTVPTDTIVVLG